MTLSMEQIADRLEIHELLTAYVEAIDTRNWDGLDEIFTEDAVIDYTEVGGPRGGLHEIKEFLAQALAGFSLFQHMIGLPLLRIEGDVAYGRTPCHNPMVLGQGDDAQLLFAGLWYRDTFSRTPQGWRISSRREENCYLRFLPPAS
jgi:ketosteroid isomerase-like protein